MIDNSEIRRMIEEDMDFKQFVWMCALNEEDTKDPSVVEFFKEKLIEAVDNYNFLESMTLTDRIAYVAKTSQDKFEQYKKYAEEEMRTVKKCEDMLEQVEEWVPPTVNHADFKKYMIDELKGIIGNGSSYYEGRIKEIETVSPIEIFDRELAAAKTKILCMEDNLIRENERAKIRRAWVDALIESIGLPHDAIK